MRRKNFSVACQCAAGAVRIDPHAAGCFYEELVGCCGGKSGVAGIRPYECAIVSGMRLRMASILAVVLIFGYLALANFASDETTV